MQLCSPVPLQQHSSTLETAEDDIRIVSFATGTKCLGANEVDEEGYSVNDSHAETLCRRAFVRFLLTELRDLIYDSGTSVFLKRISPNGDEKTGNVTFRFNEDFKLGLFLTHPPCGDASIFPKNSCGVFDKPEMNKTDVELLGPPIKSSKISPQPDLNRTGAKCVGGQFQDLKLPGLEYHRTGLFRTKPGRGSPTLSMCCSDKLAKWCVMGLQGSLCSHLIPDPIYLDRLSVASDHYSYDALYRALIIRNSKFESSTSYTKTSPKLQQIKLNFVDGKSSKADSARPNPLSLFWHLNMEVPERLTCGFKQSVNLRKLSTKSVDKRSFCASICRRKNFELFCDLFRKLCKHNEHFIQKTYYEAKLSNLKYAEAWKHLRCTYGGHWTNDEAKVVVQNFKYQ